MIKTIVRFLLAASLLWASPALAQFGTGQLGAGEIVGNSRAAQGTARAESVTAILDRALAATQGRIVCRNASAWQSCVAPVLGIPGTAAGSIAFAGLGSGTVTLQPQNAAGTPTLTFPTSSGTFAVNATSPLALSATTGMLTCPTCVTSSGGGAITGTAPISVSGAGVVSIDANGISNSLFRQSAALSIVGRASNSLGNVADISAAPGSDCVFRESGSALACGQVATAGYANDSVTDAKLRNSGALSVIGRSANSSGDPGDISASAASGAVLRESGSLLGFGQIATAGITDAAVTYAKFQNLGALELFGRASNSSGVGAGIAASAGSSCAFRESSNTIACGTLATAAYANNSVTDAKLRQSAALSLIGRSANSSGDVADISASAGSSCAFRENSNTIGCGTLATAALANNAVTNAKLGQMANNTVKCRVTAGTGDPEDCSASQGRSVLGLGTAAQQNTGTSGSNVPLLNGANTWSGAQAIAAALDVQQAASFTGDISPSQITSNQNDYAPTGFSTASVLRLSTDASRDITGLAGGADGRVIYLYNVGSQNVVLKNESGSSTAANRFGFGADLTLTPSQGASIIYDSTSSRWRTIGGPPATGVGSGTVTSISIGSGLSGASNPITSSGDVRLAIRGHIWGLKLSNNGTDATNDIDIAVGEATDNSSSVLMVLGSALTKQLDASWAVGTNQGCRDTGSIADATWHYFLIQRSDTGVVDVLCSQSATSPTMPSNYDRKRRIGSIPRASSALRSFVQIGDVFLLNSPPTTSSVTVNSSAVDLTFSIPAGINIEAIFNAYAVNSGASTVFLFYSPFATNSITLSNNNLNTTGAGAAASGQFRIPTNNANVKAISNQASNGTVSHASVGWVDARGAHE